TAQGGTQAGEADLTAVNKRIGEVEGNLAATGKRLDNMETALAVAINQIENSNKLIAESTSQIKALDDKLAHAESDTARLSGTAKEALDRAEAAGKLAEGKLVYETQLSEEAAPFSLQSTKLSDTARQALTAFADKLKQENQNVFLEIQGYTDNSGSAEANYRLALARAEAVRDFLHDDCSLPLHRMSVISYGETRPLADNKTREGRMKNRRVQLVVLK
ncbi:MAG: OmpA family protein, partial [Hydrogenophilaceae bacterium]